MKETGALASNTLASVSVRVACVPAKVAKTLFRLLRLPLRLLAEENGRSTFP
jgi:hypothetical protein